MSKIQAIPFIQKVIATLSTEEQASLAALINGSDTEPSFKSLINPIYKITSEDEGVSYCTLETQDKTFTGYLLYTDTYCVFIAFAQDTQSLSVLNINLTNQTYKFVEESLTILELRFSLEEAKEEGDIISTVQEALDDETLEVNKLNTEEGSAVKLIGLDTDGNLVEDDIPEGIVVDDALNTESDNAIANAPVANALNEKADTADLLDGSLIPNKALQAKSIEAVSAESGAVQDTPFIYQGTGTANGTSIADTSPVGKHLEKQGNSVVVNQLIDKANFSGTNTVNGITFANNNDGSWTISGTLTDTTAMYSFIQLSGATPVQNGHVYFAYLEGCKTPSKLEFYSNTYGTSNGTYRKLMNVFSSSNTSGTWWNLIVNGEIGDTINETVFPRLSDITSWTADIIADLTAHPENFFRYYNGSLAYNAGSLENSTGRYLTCGGRNVWDEIYEEGAIDESTGASKPLSNYGRSKNYIPVIPNNQYYANFSSGSMEIFYYDESKNFISHSSWAQSGTFSVPANAWYIRFVMNTTYGSVYRNDITISLYYETGDSYDQYYPYEEPKVYDTGSEVLRSAGSVRDAKAPDGTITRKVGVVDLGSLNSWSYQSIEGHENFNAILPNDLKKPSSNDVKANAMCAKYRLTISNNMYDHVAGDKSMGISATGVIYIYDSAYTSVSDFKAAMSGVYLYYELAEPTTEQGTPFAENIEINDYGTMGWDSEVPQGCKIFYPADYALFIDSVGQRQDINWDALAIVSHTELNNETDALEAKDTQLLNAVGGTLRQLLAVKESINFEDTAFVDLGTLSWEVAENNPTTYPHTFQVTISDLKQEANNLNFICSKYATGTGRDQEKCISRYNIYTANNILYITDSDYSTASTSSVATFKAAMKGVLLAYEKASE